MSRPDPGSEEADEGGQDAGAVLLDEREDVWVRGGVQDEGDKVSRLSGEGSLDGGEQEAWVERKWEQGGGQGRAGSGEEVLPPCITCHVSNVKCHVSHVTCHVSRFFLFIKWS